MNDPQKREQKARRTYFLKLETIEKLEKMAKEQNRKLSTLIDILVNAA